MQKTCPRCSVNLTLNLDSVSTPWIFARCFQCHQTNLVKSLDKINNEKINIEKISHEASPIPQMTSHYFQLSPSLLQELAASELPPLPKISARKVNTKIGFRMPKFNGPTLSNGGIVGLSLIGIGAGLLLARTQVQSEIPVRALASSVLSRHAETAQASHDTLEVHAAAALPRASQVEVVAARAILRSGPGLNYSKIGLVDGSQKLNLKSEQEGWVQIEVQALNPNDAASAWIRQDLVRKIGG